MKTTTSFAKKLLAKSGISTESAPELDIAYYRDTYPDLHALNDAELINHWLEYGCAEGRFPNEVALLQANGFASAQELNFEFDAGFYLSCYPDVKKSGVLTELQAKLHWLRHGEKESRCRTLGEWLSRYNRELLVDSTGFNITDLVVNNPELTFEQILSVLSGEFTHTVRFKNTKQENGEFYYQLAEQCFDKSRMTTEQGSMHWYQAALKAARTSYSESGETKSLEAIGKYHDYHGDVRTARATYDYLFYNNKNVGLLFEAQFVEHLLKQGEVRKALEVVKAGIKKKPHLTYLHEKLDQVIEQVYISKLGAFQLHAVLDDRTELINMYSNKAKTIYDAYYDTYNPENIVHARPLNTEKILIVGDFHVPQCIRYRIDQKVEQLESQGKKVTTVDWMKIAEHSNELALHDVVIFYRVPAVPSVIKAMAQVNANGKASFYEIDDLLFEESYPAPIETFGGYVGLDTHFELRKSMASFRAAAQLCQYGIASTNLLCKKLAKITRNKQCILHRNGLDKLNIFNRVDKSHKKTVDIFYGSGTQAHNSDFLEQALPALERILSKYSHVRLIIAGYLKLPEAFSDKYAKQLQILPPVKNVKAYWSFLEQADINLAVLCDDEINGCKSELKWFEAACFSIPSVLSTTANYRDVIHHGEDAFLASNEQEWFKSLEALIINPELRGSIASSALERVKQDYSVASLGAKLAAEIDRVVEIEFIKPKKKIALVNVFFPPQSIGGATRVLADNFDILQKQYGDDFELVVFTSDDHCTQPYQLSAYKYQGVTVYRSTILYRENMDWHPKDPEMYKLFEQFLELEKPDLVHFHCVQRLTASIVEATKDNHIPYLVTAHDAWWISDHQFLIDGDNNVYPDGHPDIFAPKTLPHNVSLGDSIERITYFKDLLSSAQSLLTVSESFADIYRKNGYPQIKVNKNGISSLTNWQPKETSYTDKVVCGHIGGMANHKGYFILKEAVEKSQPDNIEMLIVDHSKPEGYKQHTHWGKVPVTYIGRVNQSNIVELYQQIDVLFAPSMWPESYGLVTREAAACGCWVVASDLGGIGEDVVEGKSGMRSKPTMPALSEVIKSVSDKSEKFKSLVDKEKIRIADDQVKELVGIYHAE